MNIKGIDENNQVVTFRSIDVALDWCNKKRSLYEMPYRYHLNRKHPIRSIATSRVDDIVHNHKHLPEFQ